MLFKLACFNAWRLSLNLVALQNCPPTVDHFSRILLGVFILTRPNYKNISGPIWSWLCTSLFWSMLILTHIHFRFFMVIQSKDLLNATIIFPKRRKTLVLIIMHLHWNMHSLLWAVDSTTKPTIIDSIETQSHKRGKASCFWFFNIFPRCGFHLWSCH